MSTSSSESKKENAEIQTQNSPNAMQERSSASSVFRIENVNVIKFLNSYEGKRILAWRNDFAITGILNICHRYILNKLIY